MELYAIRYAQSPFFLKDIYRDRADSKESVPSDWLFYLSLVNGKAVLFDTGFRDILEADEWDLSFTDWEAELATLLGGRPVDMVVITHSHFDHIGNLDRYPGAAVLIARGALADGMAQGSDVVKKALSDSNLTVVDDELVLEGLFRFKVIGGHAAGSSVVYFNGNGREFVLTGDECYACANATENRPIGAVFCDEEKNEAFTLDTHLRGLVPLPCHDRAVFEAYPNVSANVARII